MIHIEAIFKLSLKSLKANYLKINEIEYGSTCEWCMLSLDWIINYDHLIFSKIFHDNNHYHDRTRLNWKIGGLKFSTSINSILFQRSNLKGSNSKGSNLTGRSVNQWVQIGPKPVIHGPRNPTNKLFWSLLSRRSNILVRNLFGRSVVRNFARSEISWSGIWSGLWSKVFASETDRAQNS